MKTINLSKRTTKIAIGTAVLWGLTIASMIYDKEKSISLRDTVINKQDSYICELEQFIIDNCEGDINFIVGIV